MKTADFYQQVMSQKVKEFEKNSDEQKARRLNKVLQLIEDDLDDCVGVFNPAIHSKMSAYIQLEDDSLNNAIRATLEAIGYTVTFKNVEGKTFVTVLVSL